SGAAGGGSQPHLVTLVPSNFRMSVLFPKKQKLSDTTKSKGTSVVEVQMRLKLVSTPTSNFNTLETPPSKTEIMIKNDPPQRLHVKIRLIVSENPVLSETFCE